MRRVNIGPATVDGYDAVAVVAVVAVSECENVFCLRNAAHFDFPARSATMSAGTMP